MTTRTSCLSRAAGLLRQVDDLWLTALQVGQGGSDASGWSRGDLIEPWLVYREKCSDLVEEIEGMLGEEE